MKSPVQRDVQIDALRDAGNARRGDVIAVEEPLEIRLMRDGLPEADENGGTVAGGTHVDHAAIAGMTRAELVKLIRTIDMGGQFYSRQNTAFVPYTNDPVGGGTQY